MNENNHVNGEGSVTASVSQPSDANDIDLITINDDDESEVTSTIISNNLSTQQSGKRLARNRSRKKTDSSENNSPSKAQSDSADDSICILYEKIQPPPEIEIVGDLSTDSAQNISFNAELSSQPIPPVIMGLYSDNGINGNELMLPTLPETTSSSDEPLFDWDLLISPPRPSTLSYCNYMTRSAVSQGDASSVSGRAYWPGAVSSFKPNQASMIEKLNKESNTIKIKCGICMDGPDEIAASERNLTSTTCGHIFCNTCIKESMKNTAKCPKCRKKISSKSIHNLYL